MTLFFTVSGSDPVPLGVFLKKQAGISHRMLCRLKQSGGIFCNGRPTRTIDPVIPGDRIRLCLSETEKGLPPNPDLAVPILLETPDYILYDKPPGLPVHPSIGHHGDTLGNAFSAHVPDCAFRPVSRLDRDTSGLCLAAKHATCAAALQSAIRKTYYAIVCGRLSQAGTIRAPIGRCEDSILKRCVTESGKPAITHYSPLLDTGSYTLLRVTLETGRTHQIRVHLSSIGHPLAGDALYGGSLADCSRHALHCADFQFPDPYRHIWVSAHSPLPPDLRTCLQKL